MHRIEIDCFLRQPKLSCPNHRPFKCNKTQRHGAIPPSHLPIFLETRRRCTVCSQAGKENNIFLSVYYTIQLFAFKKKGTVFYDITHKPAVTHILKTLLEHDFHDVKVLIIWDFIILFLKNLLAFIQVSLRYNIKIDYTRNHFNFF